MDYVGIDLAWGRRSRSGLALVDETGRLMTSAVVRTDDEIAAWIEEYAAEVAVVGIDAPIVVRNPTGQRASEREIARAFGKYAAAPYPSNRGNPLFDPPRAWTLAERFGWTTDPYAAGPACLEVYPHAAMVGLFDLPRRILYKKGPDRAAGFAELIGHFETITELRLHESARWRELCTIAGSPGPGDLDRIEDEIDAVLCAHLAWLWRRRPGVLRIYGDPADGCIIAPQPPAG